MRKAAMAAFRWLPAPFRRAAVHLGAPSYTVGAVALLRRPDGQILFVDQRHSEGWALPGGLLRRGESPQSAVVREVAEEVGIPLDAGTLPVPRAVVAPAVRRVDIVFEVAVGAATEASRQDEAEVRRLGWFAADALPAISDPTGDILRSLRLA